MKTILLTWLKSREAATAIEYALIAGGIAMAIVVATFALGDDLGGVFDALASAMNSSAAKI